MHIDMNNLTNVKINLSVSGPEVSRKFCDRNRCLINRLIRPYVLEFPYMKRELTSVAEVALVESIISYNKRSGVDLIKYSSLIIDNAVVNMLSKHVIRFSFRRLGSRLIKSVKQAHESVYGKTYECKEDVSDKGEPDIEIPKDKCKSGGPPTWRFYIEAGDCPTQGDYLEESIAFGISVLDLSHEVTSKGGKSYFEVTNLISHSELGVISEDLGIHVNSRLFKHVIVSGNAYVEAVALWEHLYTRRGDFNINLLRPNFPYKDTDEIAKIKLDILNEQVNKMCELKCL